MKSLPKTWHIIVTKENISKVHEVARKNGIETYLIEEGTIFGYYEWVSEECKKRHGSEPTLSYTNYESENNTFSFGKEIPNRLFMKHFFKRKTLNDE